MNDDFYAIDLLDDFITDVLAERPPSLYARMAAAIGVDVEALMHLLPMFELARHLAGASRAHDMAAAPVRERVLHVYPSRFGADGS
ncbi:MAG: hypothetical protein HUU23_15375 [Caldilineales bacterium]|nr:hypothetical protein [Caldilineales bacterium]